jgi:hypothetical protein
VHKGARPSPGECFLGDAAEQGRVPKRFQLLGLAEASVQGIEQRDESGGEKKREDERNPSVAARMR